MQSGKKWHTQNSSNNNTRNDYVTINSKYWVMKRLLKKIISYQSYSVPFSKRHPISCIIISLASSDEPKSFVWLATSSFFTHTHTFLICFHFVLKRKNQHFAELHRNGTTGYWMLIMIQCNSYGMHNKILSFVIYSNK